MSARIKDNCPICGIFHEQFQVVDTISSMFIDFIGSDGTKQGAISQHFLVVCPDTKEELTAVRKSWAGDQGDEVEIRLFTKAAYEKKWGKIVSLADRIRGGGK